MKTTAGLTHTIGSIVEGHTDNIDHMSSDDPSHQATARLNRELMGVLEKWMNSEEKLGAHKVDTMIAAMHGVTTTCGTILINTPANDRDDRFQVMRSHMIEVFDAMGQAIKEDCGGVREAK